MKRLFFQGLLALILTNVSSAATIKNFEIQNNARLSDQTIKYYLSKFKDKNYSEEIENQIVSELFELGLFSQITTEAKGEILKIIVDEVPIIESISIKGNKKLKSKTIKQELICQEGTSLTPQNLIRDKNMIRYMYNSTGRFYVKESSNVNLKGPGKAQIEFDIKEGPIVNVKNVLISGLDDTDISTKSLKTMISTKSNSIWTDIAGGSSYQPQNLSNDAEIIKFYLVSRGYADAEVLGYVAQISPDGKYFNIIFDVKPGNKYTFNEITIENPTGVDVTFDKSWLRKNSVFNMAKIDSISNHISNSLSRIGYPEIKVQPDITKNYNKKTIDVKLLIENANKYYIENIIVKNNLKTQTSIILKKMKLYEGDCFNHNNVISSVRKLNGTGFFKSVKPEVISKPNGKVDLIVNVEEKPTTHLGAEVTFATAKSPGFNLSYNESNLIGMGKAIGINLNINLDAAGDIGFSFASPTTLDFDIGTFASINFSSSSVTSDNQLRKVLGIKEENYNKNVFKLAFGASYNWSDNLSHILRYSLKNEILSLTEKEREKALARGDITAARELGKYVTSAIQNKFVLDLSPDRPFNDRNISLSLSSEIAGLGGNVRYLKSDLEYRFINQLSEDSAIKFKVSGGVIKALDNYSLRTEDKYSLGEPLVKGFESNGIGPRLDLSKIDPDKFKDAKINEGKALNGEWYYSGSIQYEKMMFTDDFMKLKGIAFIDAGSVFGVDKFYQGKLIESKSPRLSVGLGLNLEFASFLPPVTANIAYPILHQPEDKLQYFNFSVNFEF